jgi:hypothetical protein
MKKIKLAVGIIALSISASASAGMPEAVPDRWWDNMWSRLATMAENPGFCRAHPDVWICE